MARLHAGVAELADAMDLGSIGLTPVQVRFLSPALVGSAHGMTQSSNGRVFAVDGWTPTSWQSRATLQQPSWPDQGALERALADLGRLPPLVTSFEIEQLRRHQEHGETSKRIEREKSLWFGRESLHAAGTDSAGLGFFKVEQRL